MFASEFMYDKCRVNIGYEHGDKRILLGYYLGCMQPGKSLTCSFAALRLVESQLVTRSVTGNSLTFNSKLVVAFPASVLK